MAVIYTLAFFCIAGGASAVMIAIYEHFAD